jgi:hypothetical protein
MMGDRVTIDEHPRAPEPLALHGEPASPVGVRCGVVTGDDEDHRDRMGSLASPAIEALDRGMDALVFRRRLPAGHRRHHDVGLGID